VLRWQPVVLRAGTGETVRVGELEVLRIDHHANGEYPPESRPYYQRRAREQGGGRWRPASRRTLARVEEASR
jgi:hypothetical protein